MKKLLLFAGIGTLFIAMVSIPDEKTYRVDLPLPKWDKHVQGLNTTATVLDNSTLPANQVKYIKDSLITPLLNDIVTQVREQLPKDSLKNNIKGTKGN